MRLITHPVSFYGHELGFPLTIFGQAREKFSYVL